ncbi:YraN family protein [uncultured Allofournierella sp.]|uniref:YraN family protein n=1 Tax=uncultured Allofournierella sp. TaxID=1940258 RepID=UPI0025F79135|nr:YraN family protein [uncultured Fournierella sp.]
MNAQETGRRGEAAAARYYMNRGYKLLDHNYKTRQGELDLVLQKGELVVIAEVKTRAENAWYRPKEAVTWAKQRRILLAAQSYLQTNGLLEKTIRFDVVEALTLPQGGFAIHCIRDAFQA